MEKCAKVDFDLSCQISSPHYFKSSFARSMAVDCMNQSKSLDNAFLERPVTSETSTNRSSNRESVWNQSSVKGRKCDGVTEMTSVCNGNNFLKKDSDYARVVSLKKSNRQRSQSIDPARLWKTRQEAAKCSAEQNIKKTGDEQQSSQTASTESDVLRLRKVGSIIIIPSFVANLSHENIFKNLHR
ncbi:hypothetical protein L9F63_007961 [Diploptera punctata]|uniref:Uncharacterized protein n=1 Tax=Diploptera punctata TaxID=6984 RepID=A0AAD7Z6Q0_DIPPU|nr:hypothetical protein L9F63_007961 [Diploptera punctata]